MKKLQGTYRPSRDSGVVAPPGEPTAPDWLNGEQSQRFGEVVKLLAGVDGLLSESDASAIARYCADWDEYLEARRIVSEQGLTATSEKGAVYQHPAVGIRNKAHERLAKFEARFGMTPSARASLSIPSAPREAENPFLAFRNSRMEG